MSTTLTIRNLDKEVKQKLRIRAAENQRSMEAEAREILTHGVGFMQKIESPDKADRLKRIMAVSGHGKTSYAGKSTDEIMIELRGND